MTFKWNRIFLGSFMLNLKCTSSDIFEECTSYERISETFGQLLWDIKRGRGVLQHYMTIERKLQRPKVLTPQKVSRQNLLMFHVCLLDIFIHQFVMLETHSPVLWDIQIDRTAAAAGAWDCPHMMVKRNTLFSVYYGQRDSQYTWVAKTCILRSRTKETWVARHFLLHWSIRHNFPIIKFFFKSLPGHYKPW